MNNTLNINRLGKVIKRDGSTYIQNMGWTLVILFAIPLVLWLIRSITISDVPQEALSRITLINLLKIGALIIVPVRLYKDYNDSRKGISYAMLPASSLEKFISMVFYCIIVTPIIYTAGAIVVDTILAAIPGKNPYEGFAITELFNKFTAVDKFMIDNNLNINDQPVKDTITYISQISPVWFFVQRILNVIMVASIFMFGNMIFKKRKTQKMIGIIILLSIICLVIFIRIIISNEEFFNQLNEENIKQFVIKFIDYCIYGGLIISIIISTVMLWGTYHKIRIQKY